MHLPRNFEICFLLLLKIIKQVVMVSIPEMTDYSVKFNTGTGELYLGKSPSILLADDNPLIVNYTEVYVPAFAMEDFEDMTAVEPVLNITNENVTVTFSSLENIDHWYENQDVPVPTVTSEIFGNWSISSFIDEAITNDSKINIFEGTSTLLNDEETTDSLYENLTVIPILKLVNWTLIKSNLTDEITTTVLSYNRSRNEIVKALNNNISENPEDRYNDTNCIISIPDSLSYRITMKFSVLTNMTKFSEISHLFDWYLKHTLDNSLCNSIVQVSFTFDDVFTYSWINSSKDSNSCDYQNIYRLRRIFFNGSSVSEDFKNTFLPFFKLHNVVINHFGSCSLEHENNLLLLWGLCLIPCAILVLCFIFLYSQHSGKCVKNKKNILRNRQPFVFSNEIDDLASIPKVNYKHCINNDAYQETEEI